MGWVGGGPRQAGGGRGECRGSWVHFVGVAMVDGQIKGQGDIEEDMGAEEAPRG